MATSIKVVIRNKPNKQGLFPITLRITKDRKSTFSYTGHYIEKRHWDAKNQKAKKSHPNSVRLNNFIASKLAEATKQLLNLQSDYKDVTALQIKEKVQNTNQGISFKNVAQEYLIELKTNKKISRYKTDNVRIKHVLSFAKNDNLSFREIDEKFLRRFMTYLKVKREVSQRSIVNNIVVIRTLFNRAIKQGIVDRKYYPFGADKIRIKFPETEKIGLNIEEIQKIESLKELTKGQIHARNIWLFSFYFAGMRIGDVLQIRWNDFKDGRLYYRMNKNEKLLSLKIPDKIYPILKNYENSNSKNIDFIFPELKKANMNDENDILVKTNTATKKINRYLSQIAKKAELNKKLTMHIARHSFGNIAGDSIHPLMLQKLYRHSDLKTTINYQANFIHKEADDALDAVINF